LILINLPRGKTMFWFIFYFLHVDSLDSTESHYHFVIEQEKDPRTHKESSFYQELDWMLSPVSLRAGRGSFICIPPHCNRLRYRQLSRDTRYFFKNQNYGYFWSLCAHGDYKGSFLSSIVNVIIIIWVFKLKTSKKDGAIFREFWGLFTREKFYFSTNNRRLLM